jgi:hypothetical protein
MSHAGGYLKTAIKLVQGLEEGKPHTSITDWVEVLTSDRYDELSLDGIPELVESINIQGHQGTTVGLWSAYSFPVSFLVLIACTSTVLGGNGGIVTPLLPGEDLFISVATLSVPSDKQEAARAIRKKLKYGNVHRQLRALVILRALTENAGKGFKLNWANQEIVERLKQMAADVSVL